MKRILLALDQEKWNKDVVDFGCYLAKLSKSKVTGIFFQHPKDNLLETIIYKGNNHNRSDKLTASQPLEALSVKRFSEACICRDTSYSIREGHMATKEELIEETRFADLMVIDPALSLKHEIELSPTKVVKDIVQHAHCPVLLVPESFNEISEVIFTYDGSRSAVYAIKQFTYLFPQFINSKITVLEVNPDGTREIVEEQKSMEWMNTHYAHVNYAIPSGNPADKLIKYLLPRHNAIVIMGAYGRNFLSRIFKTSAAGSVTSTVTSPVFITHY
ncbi:MAG: universal stress protein [Taibaiella sp.]|jgi:hypothetical protein